jgi:hypothetical protein
MRRCHFRVNSRNLQFIVLILAIMIALDVRAPVSLPTLSTVNLLCGRHRELSQRVAASSIDHDGR